MQSGIGSIESIFYSPFSNLPRRGYTDTDILNGKSSMKIKNLILILSSLGTKGSRVFGYSRVLGSLIIGRFLGFWLLVVAWGFRLLPFLGIGACLSGLVLGCRVG